MDEWYQLKRLRRLKKPKSRRRLESYQATASDHLLFPLGPLHRSRKVGGVARMAALRVWPWQKTVEGRSSSDLLEHAAYDARIC